MVDTYAEDNALDLDPDIPGTLFEALLEDTDHLFLHEADDRNGGTLDLAKVAALDALGAASMDFDDWFQPFTGDRFVALYAYAAGAPVHEIRR
ncbi:hypothetical protein [Sinomonas mesophila]|uniref:hypothetical protein n=1 Tax=Sinomonas mesophila TaxID=1531955 RepID=UPI0009863179|nr:hypothetical protein [Sinomonas mesophila]